MTENSTKMPDPSDVPLKALRIGTRNLISSLLNPQKVIPNDSGIPRDWRGLAHLIGLKAEKIPVLACDSDPTSRILHLWQKQENPPCTIKQLQNFLGELDRFDIVDDSAEMIDKDIFYYINESETGVCEVTPVNNDVDRHILTVDDVSRLNQGLDTQHYDAFVVFADEDIDFATELIETMEKQYHLKLCVKERDLVAGLPFEHRAIIELISERCNRLIVIISSAYLKSSANKFVVNYAQALGIEQGKRKIIPCLLEPCDLPKELKHTFMLDYRRSGRLYNFWDRLNESIQTPTVHPSPRINIARTVSEDLRPNLAENLPDLKPTLVQPSVPLPRPKKDCAVKFGSLSNLTLLESNGTTRSASVNELNSECCSANGNPSPAEKKTVKNQINFFKTIFKSKKRDKNGNGCSDKTEKKSKKKFRLKSLPFIN